MPLVDTRQTAIDKKKKNRKQPTQNEKNQYAVLTSGKTMETLASPTVLVVDDDPSVVEELCELLAGNGYPPFGCQCPRDAMQLFEKHPEIGIVLCDLRMPNLNGIALLRELNRLSGTTRPFESIIFTGEGEREDIIDALRAGAADFLTKPVDIDQLLNALQRLQQRLNKRQEKFKQLDRLSQRLQFLVESVDDLHEDINHLRSGNRPDQQIQPAQPARLTAPPTPPATPSLPVLFRQLSPRQVEVARLVGRGLTNYQISCELGITENTVKLYVSQILRLTNLHNRTQLALALAPKGNESVATD
ncbi:Transcriptional regulatory protein FixJ [compost metagenome]